MKDIITFGHISKLLLSKKNMFTEHWATVSGWEWRCPCHLVYTGGGAGRITGISRMKSKLTLTEVGHSQQYFFLNCIFNWRKIALQNCVGFRTTMRVSRNCNVYSLLLEPPSPLPIPSPLDHHRGSGWAPCYAAISQQLSILHMVMYICQGYFLHSSYFLLPPLYPQVRSLCLRLHSFPVERFINSVFLDSMYMF